MIQNGYGITCIYVLAAALLALNLGFARAAIQLAVITAQLSSLALAWLIHRTHRAPAEDGGNEQRETEQSSAWRSSQASSR